MAKELGCGQGKINKIETTLVAVSTTELETMIQLYGVSAEQAHELRGLAASVHRDRNTLPRSFQAFGELSDLEPDAVEILCWHSERIPGPLQSEHYMLRQFKTVMTSSDDVIKLIRQRKARTRLFSMENAPQYRVILSESSLYRMPGGRRELIVDECEHLLALLERHERLELQILTFDADVPFVDTDFEVLRFEGSDRDFAYVESPGGARTFRALGDITNFVKHWQQLSSAALGRDDSIKFLDDLARNSLAKWLTSHD